ncbi:stage III sporulation protein AD [Paenibacillus sp. BIHB 4019]|uniref:Stage III sporulation protein AD n=1 Tax=Paenibacillus sp. BIHB 4019 TaxID=1870819 RepID=A0A1B2DLZ6_9BACL|nr:MULTISPECIES: stage III sporulation protein AD [unclassified Paenibacillus]ANY68734.1 stage III sporulation protein AD [Paenibacillus sp. BIHB 4019]KQO17507.1 stage III sporulation protein AD [Paenibacillus sp. Leaf72]
MEIIQIVGLGLIATVLILVVREQKPLFAFLLAAFTGLFIFLFLLGKIDSVIAVLTDLANRSGIPSIYLKTVLKIIGIAYIAEFGAQIVRDAGQESIASKIEFAGKILILVMAVPIISVIIETVINLLPTGGGAS